MSNIDLKNAELIERVIDQKIQNAIQKYLSSTSIHRGVKVLYTDSEDVTWVQIPGGADETPVDIRYADVSPGDMVTLRFENGNTIIEGNVSNVPISTSNYENKTERAILMATDPINSTLKSITADLGQFKILKADYAEIAELVAQKATIEDLTVTNEHVRNLAAENVTINNRLDANEANITTLTADNATINGKLTAAEADIGNLQAADATITGRLTAAEGVIDNLDANYAHITNGEIDNATIGHANVNGLNANYAHIANGAIDNATIDQARVNNLSTYYAHITNGEIDNATIDHADVNGLSANYATIANLNAEKARIDAIESNYVTTAVLNADIATINNLIAGKASVADLEAATADIETLQSTKADISLLESDYITTAVIEANYAKVDFSNATAAWIQNGVIKNGAITNAMINDVSADKLTAGTIDASRINVTNLQAKNISVEKINGVSVSGKSVADALTQHESDISDLDSKIDDEVDALNDRIDGAIETFTGTAVPTLNNSPASGWQVSGDSTATNKNYAAHVGDVYYVVNDQIPQNGYCYRFTYINNAYQWQLIKDSDVTAALQRLQRAEGDIDGLETRTATIEQFDEEIATFKTETESEISTLMTRTTTLETNVTTAQSTANGALVENVQLWFTKANATAPGKPSSHVSSTATTGNAWTTKVPVYNASYPHYYYCYEYKKADGSYAWSDVVHDEAMCESQAQGRKGVSDAAAAKAVADKNVKSSIQLWFTKANDTAPAKPSVQIVSTATTGNAWTTRVPAYNASYPKYFYCYQYELADGTYAWSDVVEDKAMAEVQSTSRTAASNASSALTQLTTKVETSVFNEVKQTVDENSNAISTLNTTTQQLRTDVNGKASQSDLISLTTTVNTVKQTADTNKASITSLNTTTQTLREDLDGLEIGGRNLLLKSNTNSASVFRYSHGNGAHTESFVDIGNGLYSFHVDITTAPTNWSMFLISCAAARQVIADSSSGDFFTISFDIKTDGTSPSGVVPNIMQSSSAKSMLAISSSESFEYNAPNEWIHVVAVGVVKDPPVDVDNQYLYIGTQPAISTATYFEIKNVKIEKGNRATDWTPAPEDTEASITEIRTTTTNKFNEVEQTLDGIETSIGEIQNDLDEKADGSTVSTLTSRVNTISDTVDGHTQTIQSVQETVTTQGNTLKKAIESSVQLWFSKADTTAPAKPTSHVSSTATTGNAWTTAVPAYNSSYPNYFYCYEWKYTDGNYGWSGVTRDIAMGETQAQARQGVSDAAAAQTTANNAATAASTADGKAVAAQNTANKNVKTSVQLWFTKANDTAPGKPSSKVTTNNAATGNAWNLAVPTYNASYPHYFYCYQYELADGTYTWSDVVYDRATTENQATSRAASAGVTTLTTKTNEISDTVDGHTSQITHVTRTVKAAEAGSGNMISNISDYWQIGSLSGSTYGYATNAGRLVPVTAPNTGQVFKVNANDNYLVKVENKFDATTKIYVGVHEQNASGTHLKDSGWQLCSNGGYLFKTLENTATVKLVFRSGDPDGVVTPWTLIDHIEDGSMTVTFIENTEADVSDLKVDYATFKQTVNQFQSTVGTTYATKTELSQASSASEITKNAEGQREITTTDAAPLPLITLTAYGESVQDGTPTPDSPVYVEAVRRKNLLSYCRGIGTFTKTQTQNGLTYEVLDDYSIKITGTATAEVNWYISNTTSGTNNNPIQVPSGIYTFSVSGITSGIKLITSGSNKNGFAYTELTSTLMKYTGTVSDGSKPFNYFLIRVNNGTAVDTIIKPMLELGTTATDYIPYGLLAIISESNNQVLDTAYLDLKGNELHGLDDTYRDQLDILADGTVQLTKRTLKIYGSELTSSNYGTNPKDGNTLGLNMNPTDPELMKKVWLGGKSVGNPLPIATFLNGSTNAASWSGGTGNLNTVSGTTTGYPHNMYACVSTNDYADYTAFNTALHTTLADEYVITGLDQSYWYTISLGKIDLPQVDDGSVVHVAAEVQPYIDASWWTKAGYSVGRLAQQSKDAQGTLEAPYTELEWVESNGTQFVYLDWKPPMETWGFEADFIIYNVFNTTQGGWKTDGTNKNGFGNVFGVRNTTNYNDIQLTSYGSGQLKIGAQSSVATGFKTDNTRQQIKLIGTTVTKTDKSTSTVTRIAEATDKPYGNMTVFAMHEGAKKSGTGYVTQPGTVRIYSLKFYDGTDLKIDLVGAKRKKDGVTGLYDKVEGHFYPAENLLCGNEVGDLGESDAVTDIIAKQNVTVNVDNSKVTRLWEASVSEFSELQDGQKIVAIFPYAVGTSKPNDIAASHSDMDWNGWDETGTTAYGNVYLRLTLSDGSVTDWIPCYYASGTRLTSHYGAGTPVSLTYREDVFYNKTSTSVGTAIMRGWWADPNYNTNDNTTTNPYEYVGKKAGAIGVWQYCLCMEDGEGCIQAIATAANGSSAVTVDTTKVANHNGFKVGGTVIYASTTYAAGANISGQRVLWNSTSLIDARYSFNVTRAAGQLTPYEPIYLVGEISEGEDGDGLFYLSDIWWTQNPNDTSKVYVLVGGVYDSTTSNIRYVLYEHNPWYLWNGTKLVEFSYSRITKNQTDILQTNKKIELKANASDVYTKTAVDGIISEEVSNLESKIEETASDITATVSSSFNKIEGGHPSMWRIDRYYRPSNITTRSVVPTRDDFIDSNLIETLYWEDDKIRTAWQLGDYYIAIAQCFVKMSADTTVSAVVQHDDAAALYVNGEFIASQTTTTNFNVSLPLTKGWNKIELFLNEHAGTDRVHFTTAITSWTNFEEFRAEYESFDSRTAYSQLKLTADGISSEVSKKVGTNEIISRINQSPEEITIDADRIKIDGTTVFGTNSTLATYLGNNYDAKGAAATAKTEAISTAASDATSKADAAKTEAISTAASDASTKADSVKNALALAKGSYTILWNYENFSTANPGEAYICKIDPLTNAKSDVNPTVMWNGVERTITKQMINPNAILPYNVPIYIVARLGSASATTATNYMVWYASGWKYAACPTPSAVGGTWTWAEETDIVLGKFVETASEAAFTECEIYNPPWSSKQLTTNTTTSQSAYNLADTANTNATNATAVVDVYPTAVDYVAGTATLAVRLTVNGTAKTPTGYVWTKGPGQTAISGGTGATLNVTDLNDIYNCKVTW